MRRVALLRGINVGGHAKVPMAALRGVFETAGCKNVETYIQSGNVAFSAPATVNAKKLETAIEKHFKLKVPVAVRTKAQLDAVVAACPYDTSLSHVGFLLGKPKARDLDASAFEPEAFTVIGDEAFFFLPNGVGNSKLMPWLGRRMGTEMTVRNWKTLLKLQEMAK